MSAVTETSAPFHANFTRLERKSRHNGKGWLEELRKDAFERFAELGFPTTRHEEWQHTNVAPLAKIPFKAAELGPNTLTIESLAALPLAHTAFTDCCNRIVLVNGHYSRDLSSSEPNDGLVVTSLAEAIEKNIPGLKENLARYAGYERNAFVALNSAFLEDGAFVSIPPGMTVEKPIHILLVSTSDERIASHPRILIIAGRGSEVSVIEDYVTLDRGVYFTNAVTEIVAGENSIIEHYKIQDESEQAFHVATVHAHQARSSSFTSHSVSFGGALVRNDVNVTLDGEGAESILNGLYVVEGRQHVDNHTVIDHAQSHCSSRELYKGILEDKSSAVFNGSIVVRADAQKTDARQSNKNLLLSEEATINSKPQLEINADDVKCSHGTTIGHLDGDSVYYLRSRGIGHKEAQAVLTYGFANDVLDKMKLDSIRVRLECALLARLSGKQIAEGK